MENNLKDDTVLEHIAKLTEREEHLYAKANITDADVKELHHIKLELDQYWDLLRQRRALLNAGQNPTAREYARLTKLNIIKNSLTG